MSTNSWNAWRVIVQGVGEVGFVHAKSEEDAMDQAIQEHGQLGSRGRHQRSSKQIFEDDDYRVEPVGSAPKGFLRFRTYEEIKAICKEQGVPFDDVRYLLDGWETVIVGRVAQGYGYVIYNVVTGKFFGVTPEEQYFTSWGHKHTLKEWYNTLLEFFYTDDPV